MIWLYLSVYYYAIVKSELLIVVLNSFNYFVFSIVVVVIRWLVINVLMKIMFLCLVTNESEDGKLK